MDRAKKIISELPKDSALVVHKAQNMRYLSGFTGEGVLALNATRRVIITDFRYEEQAAQQAPGWEVALASAKEPFATCIAKAIGDVAQLFLEFDVVTLEQYEQIRKTVKADFKPLGMQLTQMRAVKNEQEIDCIRKAAAITDEVFSYLLGIIKPGISEKQLALEVYNAHMRFGADGASFASIVASGPNSSLPHAIPTERILREGDMVTFDIGCTVGGYASDFTRTVAISGVDTQLKTIYNIVLEANLRALDALCDGKLGAQVDKAARDVIVAAGYGEYFGHSVGHGVGLEIHESPRLSPTSQDVLKAGMFATIEPGIYLPGLGGVRIEDLCLITRGGHENLTKATKELIVL